MKIKHLFLKDPVDNQFISCEKLNLIKFYGIENYKSFKKGSPRQILIADLNEIKKINLSLESLKANLIVDFAVDDLNSGQVLQIGDEALVKLTFHC